jgi:Big-like domain-containing protein/VCBS repeat protein/flagellar associated repeat protein
MSRKRLAWSIIGSFALTTAATIGILIAGMLPANAHSTFTILTAPGPGLSPLVKAYARDGATTDPTYTAYSSSFGGGVFVASGDVNGDEHADSVTGAGAGGGPHVKVVDGITGDVIHSFLAYSSSFRGGVTVAAGDVNGDGLADIITGAGPGGGPHVRVWDGDTGDLIRSFFAYSSSFRGGVTVAAGDVNGDGLADIITGAGSGGGPHVRVWDGDTGALERSFFAYPSDFRGGVWVAAGDVTGDGFADIVTGPGAAADSAPLVAIYDGDTGELVDAFFAYSESFTGGVFVATGDMNQDEFADIITGAGQGGGPHVRAWDGDTGDLIRSFFAYGSSFRGGVRVGGNLGTHPPELTITSGPADESETADATPTYGGTATDADGVISTVLVSVDFEDPVEADCTLCGTSAATWTFTPDSDLVEGEHFLLFFAIDNSGMFGFDFRTVIINGGAPTVTIDQAEGQADPTHTSPITFTATFSEPVSGFTNTDVDTSSSTAGGTLVVAVSGGPSVYTVQVSGMTTDGDVVAEIPASVATDAGGSPNDASTSTDNTVTWDATPPTVTINQGASQDDPTNTSPISFDVEFSEAVTGFTNADVTIGGTAGGTKSASVSGSGTTYTVDITGMTTSGTVTASIPASKAIDAAGNGNAASTSTDPTVTWDVTAPTFDSISANGTTTVTATFSEPLDCATVASSDFLAAVGGSPRAITGATCTGASDSTIGLTLASAPTDGQEVEISLTGTVNDPAGNAAPSALKSTTADAAAPTVTINQGASQADPTSTSPITFTAVFSEAVTGFTGTDVSIAGTAGGTKSAAVSGGPTTYTVQVSGMTTSGTVIATIPSSSATDAAGNGNAASTSSDNTVTWDSSPTVTVNQAAGQEDPTKVSPILFTATFSEAVTGFTDADVDTSASTAGGDLAAVVTGGPTVYTISISGMTDDGTVKVSIPAAAAVDTDGQGNKASTSTDNSVSWDTTSPVFNWVTATGGSTTVTAVFTALDDPLLCSSVAAGDFSATVAGHLVTVSGATCSGTSDATIDLTVSSAPAEGGSVIVGLLGTVTDRAGNIVSTHTESTTASGPTLSVTGGPADGSSTTDTTPTYSGTASDVGTPFTVSAIEVSTDGGVTWSSDDVTCLQCGVPSLAAISWSWTPTTALSTGTYTIAFRAVDDGGNLSTPTTRALTIT